MDKSPNKEELIDRYLTGMADEAEVEQLDAWLKEDEQLRQTFFCDPDGQPSPSGPSNSQRRKKPSRLVRQPFVSGGSIPEPRPVS